MNRVGRRADRRTSVAWANDYQRVTTEDESHPHEYARTVATWAPSDLGQTVREACAQVLAEFESEEFDLARFADIRVRAGLLTPSYNFLAVAPRKNECGWVPVDLPSVSLADRVLALFAVDYLWAPAAYRESLCVCRACGAVVFDREAREFGLCRVDAMQAKAAVVSHRRSGIWPSPHATGARANR
jgi:hypothetical protein